MASTLTPPGEKETDHRGKKLSAVIVVLVVFESKGPRVFCPRLSLCTGLAWTQPASLLDASRLSCCTVLRTLLELIVLCSCLQARLPMDDKGLQKIVPGAPPPQVLTAIDIMLREWTRVEAGTLPHSMIHRAACCAVLWCALQLTVSCLGADRLEWTYQRNEMQNKIDKLEKMVAEHERNKANLTRQLQALEFGLRQVSRLPHFHCCRRPHPTSHVMRMQERAKQKNKALGDNGLSVGAPNLNSTSIHTTESMGTGKGDKEQSTTANARGTEVRRSAIEWFVLCSVFVL
jgi:hypothetical protein